MRVSGSDLKWVRYACKSSPAFYDNIKEYLLSSYSIYVYLVTERSYSIHLNVNIACPKAYLWQVTTITGVTKFTGQPVWMSRSLMRPPCIETFSELSVCINNDEVLQVK